MSTALCLFRQNFRLTDNPPLHCAVEHHEHIIPLFMYDGKHYAGKETGGAQAWWLHQALCSLNASFKPHGHGLYVKHVDDRAKALVKFCKKYEVEVVYTERRWEPIERDLEEAWQQACSDEGITLKFYNASLLQEANKGTKEDGTPYLVFTPYWKKQFPKLQKEVKQPRQAPKEISIARIDEPFGEEAIESLKLMPDINWYEGMENTWDVSEEGAQKQLKNFLKKAINGYDKNRNLPAVDGTSQLSPYFHHGLINVQQVFYEANLLLQDVHGSSNAADGIKTYLSELGWREFAHHLLYHKPFTLEKALKEKYQDFPWEEDDKLLQAWQKGKTGYPIVDAAMRQLWHIGWMHNRLRMVAGSLLVKHLLQPWQSGEAWFWDTLVDGDAASNTLGWQWIGGCGADASPYFRVFNPISQSEKFDKEGEFIRTWVPELKHVSRKYIHTPWEMDKQTQQKSKCVIGDDYPRPIISHEEGRKRALEAFEKVKS